MSNVRIGINPIGWSNDDLPELGGHITLEECLSETQAAGYAGIEKGSKMSNDPAELLPQLEKYNLELIAGWYSLGLLEREADEEFAASADHRKLLKAAGSTVFIACETTGSIHTNRDAPLSSRPVMSDAQWKTFTERLQAFALLLEQDELKLAYHYHMGTVIQTAGEIDRFMFSAPENVALLLDTGHATWAGDDPTRLARNYKSRISHIHAKDIRADVMAEAKKEDWSFLNSVVAGIFTVPGDGKIDFVSTFKEVPDYKGWVVVEAEQDPAKAPPAEYAKMGHDNLVKFLKTAGLS